MPSNPPPPSMHRGGYQHTIEYSDWKECFVLWPRKDIRGKRIIGKAYKRNTYVRGLPYSYKVQYTKSLFDVLQYPGRIPKDDRPNKG